MTERAPPVGPEHAELIGPALLVQEGDPQASMLAVGKHVTVGDYPDRTGRGH